MKRFLKPRSGCGRPDLGENVHRKIFGENMVPFQGTFSRHGKAQASLALLIWLNENVLFHSTFSRHGKAQASLAQPICLNEKVPFHKIRERDNDHRLRIFPFTHKKECAAINGDASRMIFKDPKSLNLKTTIVNSNKNALFGLPIRFVGGGLVITHKSERFVTLPISCFFLLMC